jgi:Protein of unknown function (DUF4011)/REase_MTES_1575/AAA domain
MGTATTPPTEDLRPILEEVRKDLLDLGLRNPLLNYRLLKSRGLETIGTSADEAFHSLVTEGRELELLSAHGVVPRKQFLLADGDEGASVGEKAWRQPAADQQALWGLGDVPDGSLVALHGEKELESRLLATFYAARTSIEEQGVNTLFVALGMLSWSDPATLEEVHRAPILLVPVELTRQSAAEGFRLRYSGDDVSPNLCLIEFLKQFGIALDSSNDGEDFDVERYLDRFTSAISANPTWSIDRQSVVLGFFSFSKFLMYRDLDPDTWPDADALLKNDLLGRLLGTNSFAGDGSVLTDGTFLDDHLSTKECFHVVDADSTQTLALLDVARGTSMVIQGPPGTGKSQTIINLIAEALANKKKVLFVSEKQAALDVVKKRLDKIGLGNPCLELHSNKAKKKEVINELKRTAGLELFSMLPRSADKADLSATRDDLNRYCLAVNEPIGASGERPIDLFGQILPVIARLSDVENPLFDLPESINWNEVETLRIRTLIKSLQGRLYAVGVPIQHPFWGSNIRVVMPATRDRLRHDCKEAVEATVALKRDAQALASLLGSEPPSCSADFSRLRAIALRLLEAPPLKALDLQAEVWAKQQSVILKTIAAGRQLRDLRQKWAVHLRPEAWSTDVTPIRDEIQMLGSQWWRFMSSRWRSAVRQVKSLLTESRSRSVQEYLAITGAIQESHLCEEKLAESDSLLREAYLAMSFGPVNRDGGERRLNVLFSRARKRCEVFTSLSSDDIELTAASGSGLRALKHFLQFAQHGRLDLSTPAGRPPDSPFEEEVFDELQRLGYEVHAQVGCAGFFIDMAVIDPATPGRYLIGIECDGAAYHSARSARDRDRLRQAVLEGLVQ